MTYIGNYCSPIGEILIAANEDYLIGLWFKNQKYYATTIKDEPIKKDNQIIKLTKKWLDIYFSKENPNFNIPIFLEGTAFQLAVWKTLEKVPYKKTITYKDIQTILEKEYKYKIACQAIGSALGHNPILIIVPCHRVIGSDKTLKGYAAGIDKKQYLLDLENSL